MTQALEDFFAGGVKSAKFEEGAIGQVVGGKVIGEPRIIQQRDYDTDQPVVYPDGNPAMQMVVTVQAQPPTDEDNGQRAFYLRGQLKAAVRDALLSSGDKYPRPGGYLWVKLIEEKPVVLKNGKPGKPQKIHAAKYEPPAQAEAGQFFDTPAPSTTPIPPPTTAPATAPAAGLACPAGIDPEQWKRMTLEQQQRLTDVLVGGPASAEPPF